MRRRIGILFIVALVFLAGCNHEAGRKKEARTVRDQAAGFVDGQPIPKFTYSQLRQNLIEIQTAQANGIATTSFFFNQGVADPIKSCPSIGYALPSTYQLTAPQALDGTYQMESTGVYTADSTGTYVICVDAGGKGRATYWEGFVETEAGPAKWDTTTKQIVPTGEATGDFSTKKK